MYIDHNIGMTEFSEKFVTEFSEKFLTKIPCTLLFSERTLAVSVGDSWWRRRRFLVTGFGRGLGSTDFAGEELELEAGGTRARAR
jgi:hypothetical protein